MTKRIPFKPRRPETPQKVHPEGPTAVEAKDCPLTRLANADRHHKRHAEASVPVPDVSGPGIRLLSSAVYGFGDEFHDIVNANAFSMSW